MKDLLGGKGANLVEMTNLGLPIPEGFIVSTEACTDYYVNRQKIREYVKNAMESVEIKDPNNPAKLVESKLIKYSL